MDLRDSRNPGLTEPRLVGRVYGSHAYFLTTQRHEKPPRMRDQLNAGATSETTRTLKTIQTIHALIQSTKVNMKGWLWRQMIFGDLCGPKSFLIFVLQVRNKMSPRKLVPTGDRNRVRCETGAHATACSIAVYLKKYVQLNRNYFDENNFISPKSLNVIYRNVYRDFVLIFLKKN